MGLFKSKAKSGIKCPSCGSVNTQVVKGTQAVMAYPGFYSGVSNSPETEKVTMQRCLDCKIVFRLEN